jgi:hypothetical protein
MYRIVLLLVGALLAGTPAGAQPCDSTPATVVDPHIEPGITGSVCRLDRGTAYVADTRLTLVDVNTWDRPLVTGSVPLPAEARDIAVVWPRVYVACGDAGIVEVDVHDLSAPVLTRSYDPAGSVHQLVGFAGSIVALDDAENLHLLETASEGPLVAAAVRRWPYVRAVGQARGFLVVEDEYRLSTVSGFSSRGINVVDVAEDVQNPYWWAFATTDDKIVRLEKSIVDGAYTSGEIEGLYTYQVSPTGELTLTAQRTNITAEPGAMVVGAGAGFFMRSRGRDHYPPEVTLRRAADLSILATLPIVCASISADHHLLAGVSHVGLVTLPLDPVLRRQPPRDVVGNGEVRLGAGFESTTRSAQWNGEFGLLTSTRDGYSGGAYGGVSIARDYTLVYGDDPATWTTITNGRVSQFTPRSGDGTRGSASLRLAGAEGSRAVLVLDGCPRPGITVVDGGTGAVIYRDVPSYMYSDYICGWQSSYADGLLWFTDGTTVLCLDIEEALPLAPVDVTAAIAPGRLLAADRNLLVVHHADTGTYDTYDTSDLADIRQVGTLASTPPGWRDRTAWLDRRFLVSGTTTLTVIDFTDPAAPVVRSNVTLPYSTTGMTFAGDRVVFRSDEPLYGPPRNNCRFQVADLAADGTVTLHAPSHAIPTTDGVTSQSCALSGNILYADLGYAVRAYDLADPGHPVAVGETRNGSGMVAIFGEYLASGSFLSPRHCLDLPPVRSVAVEALRMVKPGAGNALVEIAVRPSPGFDPAQIDVATVRFGPREAAPVPPPAEAATPARRPRVTPSDGDPAAATGVTFWFHLDEAGITPATATATLDAMTLAGEHVQGTVRLDVPAPEAGTDVVLAVSPNPFNPQTTLRFVLTQDGPCSLAIYDLQGRRVRALVDGVHPAGDHAVLWDGRDERGTAVASGVYFARLASPDGTRTERLALVR